MRSKRAFGETHASLTYPCDLCHQLGVFHWTMTYPDLVLCRDCLEHYPEAVGAPRYCQHRRTSGLQPDDSTYCFDCGWTFVADG